jgi:chromosome segregation ATPase
MAEVIQLRSILQTLQAENIALKAQVGQFSDEEKQIRSEITLTSTEIVTLIQELTGLRNRVAEARIQLLEATAELKVLTDKKEYVSGDDTFDSSIHIDHVIISCWYCM